MNLTIYYSLNDNKERGREKGSEPCKKKTILKIHCIKINGVPLQLHHKWNKLTLSTMLDIALHLLSLTASPILSECQKTIFFIIFKQKVYINAFSKALRLPIEVLGVLPYSCEGGSRRRYKNQTLLVQNSTIYHKSDQCINNLDQNGALYRRFCNRHWNLEGKEFLVLSLV